MRRDSAFLRTETLKETIPMMLAIGVSRVLVQMIRHTWPPVSGIIGGAAFGGPWPRLSTGACTKKIGDDPIRNRHPRRHSRHRRRHCYSMTTFNNSLTQISFEDNGKHHLLYPKHYFHRIQRRPGKPCVPRWKP